MTDHDAVPTVPEELARKTFDELTRLSEMVEAGRLEPGEFSLCARSIWNITSGLIDSEHMGLVQQAADTYPGPVRRVHWLKEGNVYTFAWDPEKDHYAFVKRGVSNPKPVSSLVRVDRLDRIDRLEKLFSALLKTGWTRL